MAKNEEEQERYRPTVLRHLAGQELRLGPYGNVLKKVVHTTNRPQIPGLLHSSAAKIRFKVCDGIVDSVDPVEGHAVVCIFDKDMGWFDLPEDVSVEEILREEAERTEDAVAEGANDDPLLAFSTRRSWRKWDVPIAARLGNYVYSHALANVIRTMVVGEKALFQYVGPEEPNAYPNMEFDKGFTVYVECEELYSREKLNPLDYCSLVESWNSFDPMIDTVRYKERCHENEYQVVYDQEAWLFVPLSVQKDSRRCQILSVVEFDMSVCTREGTETWENEQCTIGLADINPWLEQALTGECTLLLDCFILLPLQPREDIIRRKDWGDCASCSDLLAVSDKSYDDVEYYIPLDEEHAFDARYRRSPEDVTYRKGRFGILPSSRNQKRFMNLTHGAIVTSLIVRKIWLLPDIRSGVYDPITDTNSAHESSRQQDGKNSEQDGECSEPSGQKTEDKATKDEAVFKASNNESSAAEAKSTEAKSTEAKSTEGEPAGSKGLDVDDSSEGFVSSEDEYGSDLVSEEYDPAAYKSQEVGGEPLEADEVYGYILSYARRIMVLGDGLSARGLHLDAFRLYSLALTDLECQSTNVEYEKCRELPLIQVRRGLRKKMVGNLCFLGGYRHALWMLNEYLVDDCPDDPEIYLWLGRAEQGLGRYDSSITRFKYGALLTTAEPSRPRGDGSGTYRAGSRTNGAGSGTNRAGSGTDWIDWQKEIDASNRLIREAPKSHFDFAGAFKGYSDGRQSVDHQNVGRAVEAAATPSQGRTVERRSINMDSEEERPEYERLLAEHAVKLGTSEFRPPVPPDEFDVSRFGRSCRHRVRYSECSQCSEDADCAEWFDDFGSHNERLQISDAYLNDETRHFLERFGFQCRPVRPAATEDPDHPQYLADDYSEDNPQELKDDHPKILEDIYGGSHDDGSDDGCSPDDSPDDSLLDD
ncbi:hypothetical protein GNI_124570 [Gregarina niphandrodes]|uniref:Tetratricopeptide repeat protein n=1 Tax=Gregarina niphandrodes TaxID=110365 RepID=A0A023B281_GRENI|nr:hypothetical protein GNI_124570 [Gregarina niphandrodes]EZG51422.1 hypothetical protein GNI_124570 [Gregarina niphandrodes]|eukprot:XP_011131977.1 hypothetical protein GNI_124570 [Gregarina niphandrodes]